MAKIVWDQVDERTYETGVDHGVLYLPDNNGNYVTGVAWNGLTTVTESPSGAESNPQYADNIQYLNLISAEVFAATIEAVSFPVEFHMFDGLGTPTEGVTVGQQTRKKFGFAYRTLVGDAVQGNKAGEKIHVVYNCVAAPSERAHATVNDTPESMAMSWAISTTPVPVPNFDPSATLTVDSRTVDPDTYETFKTILYGSAGIDPRLPFPAEIIGMFESGVTVANPTEPAYNDTTHVITIPTVTGVTYQVGGEDVPAGTITLDVDETIVVTAVPQMGYFFPEGSVDEWGYTY